MSTTTMHALGRAWLLAACLLSSGLSLAEPYAPASDDAVVETVKAGSVRPAALRSTWAQAAGPDRTRAALDYARAAIEQARREGDPRWLGAAQAALGPWWSQATPPAAARLLRATVLQSLHDFNAALMDLDAVVDGRRVPEALRLQARFTRASVLQVQGRWRDAAGDCRALASQAPLESAACLAELRGLGGDAPYARAALHRLASQAGTPAQQAWLALMQAELAERMGHAREADILYRQALQANPDCYTLGAYADFLLDADRPAEVARLLQGHEQVDALLLRLAIAWQRMGPSKAAQLQQAQTVLQASFDAARLRGERVHMREEARFELVLEHRPRAALALAEANWAVQREPIDARVLMDAAKAAGQAPALSALQAWVRQQGLADARLAGIDKALATVSSTQPSGRSS
jgi:hypothetical protein